MTIADLLLILLYSAGCLVLALVNLWLLRLLYLFGREFYLMRQLDKTIDEAARVARFGNWGGHQ